MQKLQWTRNGKKLETIPTWQLEKIKSNEGGYSRSTKRDKSKVHFATLMDMCHVKNAESVPKTQNIKGRVVLRGDIVKDDSGGHAVWY